MDQRAREQQLNRIYRSFAERDLAGMQAEAAPDFEFQTVTGARLGRTEPYRGPDGLAEYMADVERAWVELRLVVHGFEHREDATLATGRVWARTSDALTDLPAGWVWLYRDGRLVRGEVYDSVEAARERFDGLA
jgi:ketosteroid isomerase-like protein